MAFSAKRPLLVKAPARSYDKGSPLLTRRISASTWSHSLAAGSRKVDRCGRPKLPTQDLLSGAYRPAGWADGPQIHEIVAIGANLANCRHADPSDLDI
jgi:hypothetical protein